jgi:hypothetical protein
MPETLELRLQKDLLAAEIGDKWVKWDTSRTTWMEGQKELQAYLFATDTRSTTNSKLPWKNSTVTPKLTQIRDNLHANYMAALFPNDNWFVWQAGDNDAASGKKRTAIESYMRTKLRECSFDITVSQLVYDYIDAGNVFVGHEFVNLTKKDPDTGEEIVMYQGPRPFRVSPLDIVMDPTAPSFDRAPFIRRIVKTVGDLQRDVATRPDLGYSEEVVKKVMDIRTGLKVYADQLKNDGMVIAGFGNVEEYLTSGMVEILEFWGDVFDPDTNKLYLDQVISVADRRWVLRKQENKSWLGKRPYFHCGWRLRPDNLWAQGPLDQLVGMQYRVDHLENLKADVFDLIAHPVTKIKGTTVEDFKWGPGVQIECGDEGDVEMLSPDTTALNADMQIDILLNKMEELAGAPRQAMGIRTPGEKTKYEVQVLENGAGRIFQSKVNWFERNVVEPLLNSMLEDARRNMGAKDQIRTIDEEFGTEQFIDITKEDITAKGKLFPVGARHFAEEAKFVQDMAQTLPMIEQLPTVKVHFSGIGIAKALEEHLGWKRFNIVKNNIAITEQLETQRLMQAAQESAAVEAGIPSEPQPEDYESVPRNTQQEGAMNV